LKDFYQAVCLYIHKNENQGIKNLEKALSPFKSVNADLSPYYLAKAKDIILSLGRFYGYRGRLPDKNLSIH